MYRYKCNYSLATLRQFIVCRNEYVPYRMLYSQTALGIDSYSKTRERVKSQFSNAYDNFRNKMQEFVEPASANMIFTEDLKNMVHLVEGKNDDVQLVMKMMQKFNSQNRDLRFGSFVFGPVVMRLFYFLDDHKSALKCFQDPQLMGFFDQLMSYQILMDLLLKHKRYDDIIAVFNIIKNQQIQGARFPKHAVVLVFAAFYHQNTSDSLKQAKTLWAELLKVGHFPMRRAATFMAGLALNQHDPNVALEVISTVKQQNYFTIMNIKVAALASLGRPDDALPVLRSVLDIDNSVNTKHTFSKEIIEKLKQSIDLLNNSEVTAEFNKIEKLLKLHGHYTDTTLAELLCTEINSTGLLSHQQGSVRDRDRRVLAASFDGNRAHRSYKYDGGRRAGLTDIY